jgi:hypothetical protein
VRERMWASRAKPSVRYREREGLTDGARATPFHVFLGGETTDRRATTLGPMATLTDFDRGVIVGLLIGEGSFGGDGKQPQVTLRMHVRHESLFRWLVERIPNSRLYGPYHHGGRSYYQWMARGRTLVRDVLPLLERELDGELDAYAAERMAQMRQRYAGYIERERTREEA